MKPTSELLEETAISLNLGMLQLRSLEQAAIQLMAGRDYQRLSAAESHLLGVMTGMGLLETRNGFVRDARGIFQQALLQTETPKIAKEHSQCP